MQYYIKTSPSGNTSIYYMNCNVCVSFGEWEANTDYQEYLKWLAEGNTPESAE